MNTRTWAAVLLGFGILIASIVVEEVCGLYSENCGINWSEFYGTRATYVPIETVEQPTESVHAFITPIAFRRAHHTPSRTRPRRANRGCRGCRPRT